MRWRRRRTSKVRVDTGLRYGQRRGARDVALRGRGPTTRATTRRIPLSGTRFNSKLEDLGASMTIVTKEQMHGFRHARYQRRVRTIPRVRRARGAFTDFTVDRNGSVSDNVQMNPTQANRVRGLSSANISLGNVETSGRTPVDPLAIDGLEISRGPQLDDLWQRQPVGLGEPRAGQREPVARSLYNSPCARTATRATAPVSI